MGSVQSSVKAARCSVGSLFHRDVLGVPCAVAVPPPSLQLLAGMLLQHHPRSYPDMLLRAVATNGRNLDRYQVRPTTQLEELDLQHLSAHSLLQGDHLSAVEKAIMLRGNVKLVQVNDELPEISQLHRYEVFEASPVDASSLQLVEPQLLTVAQMAKARAKCEKDREAALAVAEGFLLEVLLRKDLTHSLLKRLKLAGEAQPHDAQKPQKHRNCYHCPALTCKASSLPCADKGKPDLWWGNVRKAELDLVLELPDGPVVWVSCKWQHESQDCRAFLRHVNNLQVALPAGWRVQATLHACLDGILHTNALRSCCVV